MKMDPEGKGGVSSYESKMYSADSKSVAPKVAGGPYFYNPVTGSSTAAATPARLNTANDMGDDWYTANSTANSAKTSPTASPLQNNNFRQYDSNPVGNSNNGLGGFLGSLLRSYGNQNNPGEFNNMNNGYNYSQSEDENYDNEPPLLEELGVNFEHIWKKTQAVMYPTKQIERNILEDTDLAGPLFFCLLLGSCLLLAGKVQFGYIYGFSVFGCLGLMLIVNLLHPTGVDFWTTCSALGYCLIPVIVLAAISILLNLQGPLGLILSIISITWATRAATSLLDAKLELTANGQYWLVAYPVMLLYSCFVLITIF
mmetsp:Transcript_2445/g.3395  ORF Transcript_2445/g.3395 Transcript_2445/m.3395 type:complete len:313 (+) Transcript_2445:18-956(+)